IVRYLGEGRVPQGNEEWRDMVLKQAKRTFILEDAILYKITREKRRTVIPEKKKKEILYLIHDHQLAGHMGVSNTLYRAKNLWWPNMENNIQEYILTCDICQKRKKNKEEATREKSETPTKRFKHI